MSSSRRLSNQSTHSKVVELDGLEAGPWSAPMDHLGLVETVDGFRESVVTVISDAADRSLDTTFSKAFGVIDRDVLGGFKRSSQHSEVGGCDERCKAAIGAVRTSPVSIARTAVCCRTR
jgi:hypothetical protein